jgi:hypothetical protein
VQILANAGSIINAIQERVFVSELRIRIQWIRIRIRVFDDQKLKEKSTAKNVSKSFFDHKLQFTYIQAAGKAFSPQKRTSIPSKKGKFINFFLCVVSHFLPSWIRIRIAIPDPDTDSGIPLNPDPDMDSDPDPHLCFVSMKEYLCRRLVKAVQKMCNFVPDVSQFSHNTPRHLALHTNI